MIYTRHFTWKKILKLKKLVLYGFKSFADKTVIEFKEGLSAIVGPNGCGKSNVVDALRWVMGETQAKAIRGEKMYDVLFNGTKTRTKTSYAEVSLLFDEIDGALGVPYEEVMVTRRLFADGTSSYFLNKKEVRLKDLTALFANTGIGKNAFWVFEQGRIDQIVTMSPVELRAIFEDAAGISLYLFQKKEAKGRLKEVESNLLRANDRMAEKEKFLALLRKQKEDAETYRTAKSALEVHEKGLFYKKLKSIETKMEELQAAARQVSSECEEKSLLAQQKKEHSQTEEEKLKAIQLQKEEKKERLQKSKTDLALLEKQKQFLTQEIQEKEQRIFSLYTQLKSLEKELEEFQQCHPEKLEKFKALRDQLEAVQLLYNQEKQANHNLTAQVQEAGQKERKAQDSLFALQKAIQKGQFDLHTLDLKKENGMKERDECQTLFDATLASVDARAIKKKNFQEELNFLRTEFERVKAVLLEKQEQLRSLNQKLSQVGEQNQLEMRKIAELQAKIHSLHSLKSEMEGASTGTKDLYKAFPHFKPLAELLDVESDFAEAIANALHPYSHTLVCEDREQLEGALAYIQAKQLHNVSLLSRSTLKGADLNTESLATVCHPLDLSIHLFNDIPLSSWKEGFYTTPKNLITRTKVGEQNAFMRQGEIKKLHKEVEKRQKIKEEIEKSLTGLAASKETLLGEIREVEAKSKQKEIKLMEIKFHLQNETEQHKKEEERKNQLQTKLASLEQQLLPIDAQKEKLLAAIHSQEEELSATQCSLDQIKRELEHSKEHLSSKSHRVQALEKDVFALIGTKERMKGELQSAEYKHKQQAQQVEALQKELHAIELFLEKGQKELRELPLAPLQETLHSLEAAYQQICTQCAEELILHAATQEELQRVTDTAASLKERRQELEMKLFEQKVKKEALEQELQEKYPHCTLEPPPFELSFDKYEQKIKELKGILTALPSINPNASDDHALEEQEMLTLQTQIADLKVSTDRVQKLIAELEEKSTALFEETFHAVSKNFTKNFQTLFNGGNAELVLKPSPDLLETEVEIKCEPPGKALKSLQLLSGGEKCLTAIALLFALFQVKPAPMCLLDEIDAPLDESNARRFLDLIEPFSNQTKIILVTHNKLTMERAHQLIGISMQEKGVTTVLDLVQLEQQATLV